MFGFLIGGASLLGLIWVLKGGRHGHRHRHGPWGGGWHTRRHGFIGMLFERLDTTPGQEKAIRSALDEVMARGRELKDDTGALRRAAAEALRDPVFDAARLDDAVARQGVAFNELQKAVVAALGSVHDTLDDEQRRRLAHLVASGPGHYRRACGGPYRHWSGHAETWT